MYDILIFGNDPTVHWLLHFLSKSFPTLKAGEIRYSGEQSIVPLVPRLAIQNLYHCDETPYDSTAFTPQFVTPKATMTWSEEQVLRRYPLTSLYLSSQSQKQKLLFPKDPEFQWASTLIRKYPEILSYSQGLWKMIGRTRTLSPESSVLFGLIATSLVEWSPWNHWERNWEVFNSADKDLTWKKIKEGYLVTWTDDKGQSKSAETKLLSVPAKSLSPSTTCLFPLELEVKPGTVPWPSPRAFIILEEPLFPHPELEIWPVEFFPSGNPSQSDRMKVWMTHPNFISLESLEERSRKALKMLYRFFPFMPWSTLSLFPTLDSLSCFSEQNREESLQYWDNQKRPLWDQTLLELQSLDKGVFGWGPQTRSHLPYPLGPLSALGPLLLPLIGRKQFKSISLPAIH